MRRLQGWFSRIGGMFSKERRDREFSAEMDSHLAMHIDDNVRAGMSVEQARREALMKLGGVEQTKENYRERRGLPVLEVLLQDVRFGARMLCKNPGFTFVAVLTLALGISANATIFSFVSAVLYSRPPVSDSERVLVVYGTSMTKLWGPNLNPVSAPNYFIWKKENKVFDDLAATDPYYSSSLTGQGEPERVSTTRATANYFPILGVTPELGRTFVAGEDQSGHDHVVILNHELWERRFGSDRTLVGKTIRLNGEAYTVIGVMPPRFRLMSFLAQVWIPLVLDESQQSAAARENRNLFLFARLKPGATLEQAQANITTLGTIAAQSFPQTENGWGAYTLALQEYLIRDFNAGPAFIILLSAVGFVLLIACANIAGLLIARAAGRGKEMAVRIAIGAGRLRVVRQLMTEAMLIALLGAAAGLALALFGQRLLQTAMSFNDAVKLLELKLDWRVLCFTASISVFSALLFGLAPALKAWSVEVFSTLKNDSSTVSSGKKKSRMRNVLVAGEVALAVVLLTATGIMLKGFIEGLHRSLGFKPQHLLTAQITLPDSPYKEPAKQIQFYRDLISHLEAIPGAKSAAVSSVLPATGPENVAFRLQGQENLPAGERARARHFVVSSQYLEATEIALLAGRGFSESDDAKSPAVALVSEKFVERFFPRGDALGKQILIDSGDAAASQWREIVGIVRNVKSWPIQLSDDPEIYEPFQQHPLEEMAVIVRANGDANSLAPGLRESVWAIDRDQPIGSIISMPEILANETAGERIMGTLMGTFGALALLLAGIGIYGLVAFTVGQRSREIGIRLAMGAEKKSILRLVLRDGMKLALIGLAIGMAGALPLPQAFGSLLQDFRVSGGWLFVIVPALIGGVALLACFIPARRAARVDPMVSLRHE